MMDVRRNVKWSMSMMLPEHVALLREFKEEIKLVEKPYLDEYALGELQDDLERAYSTKADITIRTWRNGVIEEFNGEIESIDVPSKTLWLQSPLMDYKIRIEEMVYVRLND